jgi:hypothetical protein
MRHRKYDCVLTLREAGISFDDATALRRISMTLHRWHELECGDGNDYGSWAIARGSKTGKVFTHDDDGAPYLEHHHYLHGRGKDYVSYTRLPDRERGALKRLAALILRYPGFAFYVQGDPRGCALYILRPDDLKGVEDIHSCYNRGVAVCR